MPTDSSLLVLVADDEPGMLSLVAQHLRTRGHRVVEASDGEQAMALARRHLPDLVVLDVMMPAMSGWEVCRHVREEVALAHTAVVMLTGIGENLNQMTSPLYGADAFLDKPFDLDELDAKIDTALSVRGRALHATAGARPATKPAKKTAKKPPAKAAKKTAKKPPAKAAKKTAKKPPAKAAKKTVKKPAKKPGPRRTPTR